MADVSKGTYNAPARPGPVASNAPDDRVTKELPKYKIQVIFTAGTSVETDTFYCDRQDPVYASQEVEWTATHLLNGRKIQMVPSNRKYSRAFVIKIVSRETKELDDLKAYGWSY